MGTEQPTQQAPWGAGGRGCLLVLLSRVPYAVRCHATRLRRGSPSGRHRGRAGSDGVASHKAGFRSRRFPAPACSRITLPLPSPGPASVPCLPPPGARPLSLVSPAARRGRRNRGPGCSLGARSVRARQSRDKAPCSASHPHSSQPRWTPSLRLWGSPRLLGLHSPSLPSSPAGALRTQALVRRFVVASAASFLLGGLARSRHFKYHL